MGRHLLRLLHPVFLLKMVRTNAPGLYGWDILLRGTVGSGPIIGRRLASVIRACADAGHEIGLHAWDHHAWQTRVSRMTGPEIKSILQQGVDLLTDILGRPPACSASPAWRCSDAVLLEKLAFPFAFNSDCRGDRLFRPVVAGRELSQPQIPTTLPTYDEVVGRHGISAANFNQYLLRQVKPGQLNVLTIHAESEGIGCREQFDQFLSQARAQDLTFVPLGALLPAQGHPLPSAAITAGRVAGREGWISCQAPPGRSPTSRAPVPGDLP